MAPTLPEFPLEEAPSTIIDALRRPERFVHAWHVHGTRAYPLSIFALLFGVSVAATASYGMAMGLPFGIGLALERALTVPLACGLAWSLALPTFFIVGGLRGMKLRGSTMLLVAIVTVHYAALALLASIPVHLFFASTLSGHTPVLIVNLIIFMGVGLCGSDVLLRVVREVAPRSTGFARMWLLLLGVLGPELFLYFGLFDFAA